MPFPTGAAFIFEKYQPGYFSFSSFQLTSTPVNYGKLTED